MRTTESARYARWSAAVAVVLSLIVAGVYARRSRRAPDVGKATQVPSSVQQQTAGFSLSKVEGNHTQFTVRASRATEFKGGGRSLLEDVWVTAYGGSGQRDDNLHTRSCEYAAATGSFTCAGEVQIDLQNAGDRAVANGDSASLTTAAGAMHIRTSGLSFDSRTGVATSDQPVSFSFARGEGEAIGFQFETHGGQLQLSRNVHLTLRPSSSAADASVHAKSASRGKRAGASEGIAEGASARGGGEVNISSSSLVYTREERVIHMLGPVEATEGSRTLRSPMLDVELDQDLNIRWVIADGRPQLTGGDGGSLFFSADRIETTVAKDGSIERIDAVGDVRSNARRADSTDHLAARQVEFEYASGTNQLRRMTATGGVALQSDLAGGTTRRMATSELAVEFATDAKNGQAYATRASAPETTLDTTTPAQPAAHSGAQRMHLESKQIEAGFAEKGALQNFRGWGGVAIWRQIGDAAPVTATSREVAAQFGSDGEWTTIEQDGEVVLREGDKVAESPKVHFTRSSETATLAGLVSLEDASSQTTARSATFLQTSNEFRAEGNVVTTQAAVSASNDSTKAGDSAKAGDEAKPASPKTNVDSDEHPPARISADHLVVNTMTGHATYTGRVRLWQGNSIVESDRADLDRDASTLVAAGHVRAVFPHLQGPNSQGPNAQGPNAQGLLAAGSPVALSRKAASVGVAKPGAETTFGAGERDLVYSEAGRLTYFGKEHRAHLEQSPCVRTGQGTIRSTTMDLFFTQAASNSQSILPQASAFPNATGNESVERANAVGRVVVQNDDRHAKSERADYTTADGKFVLSGGPPTISDSLGNSITGRELTFISGDDKIVVDSEEGSRTLTLHRVQK